MKEDTRQEFVEVWKELLKYAQRISKILDWAIATKNRVEALEINIESYKLTSTEQDISQVRAIDALAERVKALESKAQPEAPGGMTLTAEQVEKLKKLPWRVPLPEQVMEVLNEIFD